jgi:2,3-diketo-5-methylthiopentyl-1-phosphate enolase
MTLTLIDRPDLIQVTYQVLSEKLIDPEKKARSIAIGHTTDSWTPSDPLGKKMQAKLGGIVLGIDERTHLEGQPYEYHLTVGFPPANTEGDIPSLLLMVLGRTNPEERTRIESIQFPENFRKGKGPRHGIPGLRSLLKEPAKPLQMGMVRPGIGFSPEDYAAQFYDLAMGGMHLVKEDEILLDLASCPVEKRLEACLKSGQRAMEESGRRTLLAVNLTGPISRLPAKARKLQKLGAECFQISVFAYSYGILEELREIGLPLVVSPALTAMTGSSQTTGISYGVLLGSLMRLGGADCVIFPSGYGAARLPSTEIHDIKTALTKPFSSLERTWPAPADGIHPGKLPLILKEYGNDVIINAGRDVHLHPKGPRAGAKAFHQAIEFVLQRGNFGGLQQREFPELADALRLWGKA